MRSQIGGSSSVLAFLICFSKPCFLEAFLLAGGSGPSWALLVALPRFRPRLQGARSGISGDIVGGAGGPASRPGRGARGAGRQPCFRILVSPYLHISAGVVSVGCPAPPLNTSLYLKISVSLYISVSPYLRWRCKSRLTPSSPYARQSSRIKQRTDTYVDVGLYFG